MVMASPRKEADVPTLSLYQLLEFIIHKIALARNQNRSPRMFISWAICWAIARRLAWTCWCVARICCTRDGSAVLGDRVWSKNLNRKGYLGIPTIYE